MKPDARVLDQNLRGLLRRAYVPALPREEFHARLAGELAAALQRRSARAPERFRARLPRPVLLAAAAGLLVAAGFLLRALLAPAALSATAEEALTRAPVALRVLHGWRAATSAELAHGLTLGAEPIEVALAPAVELELRAADGRLRVSGEARLALEPGPALAGTLGRGALLLERDAPTSAAPWTLRAGANIVAFERGALGLEVAGQRASFRLERGGAAVMGAREHFVLVPHEELLLVAGLPTNGAPGPTATAAGARSPLPALSAPAPAAAATGLVGSVRDANGLSVARFRVALLPRREGNELRSPLVRDFEAADGSFAWPDVPPGSYAPFVWAEGFALAVAHELAFVAGGAAQRLDLRLERGARLRGRVLDAATGAGVADALVVSERDTPDHMLLFGDADRSQWLPAATRTAPDGAFELAHLSRGTHTLRASAAGFGPGWGGPLELDEARPGAELEIRLGPGGAVEGLALGADGLPSVGERLLVTPMDSTIDEERHPQTNIAHVITDEEGRFRAADLPLGHALVIRAVDGAAPPVVKPVELRAGECAWVEFSAEGSGTRLAGRLLDADGAPLGGQNLALYAREPADGESFDDFLATGTLADGSFTFEHLAPGGYRLFRVGRMGRWVRLVDEVEVPPVAVFTREFRVGPGAITGFLRERTSGAPVRAALLLVERVDGPPGGHPDAGFAGTAESEPTGEFVVDGLPPGRYVLRVHATSGGLGQERSGELVLSAAEPQAVVGLELAPGGAIEVHAVDADGAPLARAEVLFVDEQENVSTFAQFPRTDGRGIFLAQGVKPGRYRVRASARGFESGTTSVECRAGETARAEVVLEAVRGEKKGNGR